MSSESARTDNSHVRLDGKVAIVTGSTAGWGRSIAESLAERGAYVAINGRRRATIDEVVTQINGAGGRAIGVPADVSEVSDVERLVDTVRSEFGRVDIMINNATANYQGAGTELGRPLLDLTDESWEATLKGALTSAMYGSRAAARAMVQQGGGGRIINMAGATGLYGMVNAGAGTAAKGGLVSATYSWALELAKCDITVNAVRSSIATATTAPMLERIQRLRAEAGQPASSPRELEFFEPHEAASAVVWLASDAAAQVTGRLIGIDGPKLTIYGPSRPTHHLFHEPYWDFDAVDAKVAPVLAALPNTPGIAVEKPSMGILIDAYNSASES